MALLRSVYRRGLIRAVGSDSLLRANGLGLELGILRIKHREQAPMAIRGRCDDGPISWRKLVYLKTSDEFDCTCRLSSCEGAGRSRRDFLLRCRRGAVRAEHECLAH